MKKNLINRFAVIIITGLFTFTAANTFAGNSIQSLKTNNLQTIARDTPYLAAVLISQSGMADTPYLKFSIAPKALDIQLKSLLRLQNGLFHVLITYLNQEGELLYEEDYYIDNRY